MANARLAAIGLFVLIGGVLAFTTVVLFGRLNLFGETRAAEIVFDGSVNGLGVGSPVTFRGVRVGAVSSVAIAFDPKTHEAHIPVKIRLAQSSVILPKAASKQAGEISRWVAEGLRAEVVPVSLIADESEIDLDFNRSIPAKLHPELADLPEIPVNDAAGGQIAQELSTLPRAMRYRRCRASSDCPTRSRKTCQLSWIPRCELRRRRPKRSVRRRTRSRPCRAGSM